MPRTRKDLIVEVLDKLNVTDVGQDPSAEDAEKVSKMIPGVFDSLARRDILYVQNVDAIDDEYFDALAILVANRTASKFGQPYDQGVELREEANLRDMQRRPRGDDVLQSVYY